MTWTAYDPSMPTDRDAVRWRIGDVDSSDPKQSDEEIAHALTEAGSVLGAAVLCVRALKARFAPDAYDRTATGFTSAMSQRYTQYTELLAQLERELAAGAPGAIGTRNIQVGGKDIARNVVLRSSATLAKPRFSLGRDDYT